MFRSLYHSFEFVFTVSLTVLCLVVVWIVALFCEPGRAEFPVGALKSHVVVLVTRLVARVPDAGAWFSRLPGDSSSRDVGCRRSALSGFLPHLKRLVFRVGRPRFQKWTRGVRVYVRSALFVHMATVLISVG